MPACPTKWVTGLDCPACGGLRLVHDLLHGNLRAAMRDNAFLVLMSPLLVYLVWRHARAVRGGERFEVPAWLAYGTGGLAVSWMVLRNLPGWPWKPITGHSGRT
jgi:hypothetical protein